MHDLTPPGHSMAPADINSDGVIVGNGWTGKPPSVALLAAKGIDQVLAFQGGARSSAHAINDAGTVVGNVCEERYACYWQGSECIILDPPRGRFEGYAMDINNHGVIVGIHGNDCDGNDCDGEELCCTVWVKGRCTDNVEPELLPYEEFHQPYRIAINDHGVMTSRISESGFVKDGERFERIVAPGNGLVNPIAINIVGVVVGRVHELHEDGDKEYAFRYAAGEFESLGTIAGSESRASGINDHGVIVGESSVEPDNSKIHGFLFFDNRMYDLNDLVESLDNLFIRNAAAINNRGQIAAIGVRDDEHRALLLEPIT